MLPIEALTNDLRLLCRAGATLMAFLLLPWLFISASWSFPHWPQESAAPAAPATAAVPVPAAYPAIVTYVPVPLAVVERWIQRRYPHSLVGLAELRVIDGAARHWDVSLPLLLGMLGAEQGFLRYVPGNRMHALEFAENPFDYGVWPGSPYPLAIGLKASATGAASIVARIAEMFPAGAWSAATYRAFYGALSGWYRWGNVLRTDRTWLRNVVLISAGIWGAVRADAVAWVLTLARRLTAGQLAALAAAVRRAAGALGAALSGVGGQVVVAVVGIAAAVAAAAGAVAAWLGGAGTALPMVVLAA